jgi:SAM-dependent methyltransferase
MLDTINQKQITDVLEKFPDKLVLSNRTDKSHIYKKTVIQKIVLKGREAYQIERFTDRQASHENVDSNTLTEAVFELFPSIYSQLNIFGNERQWDFKVTKKGKLLSNVHEKSGCMDKPDTRGGQPDKSSDGIGNKRIFVEAEPLMSHNRKKNYLLKEGMVIPPLADLGIFTKDGKVVRNMYDKYRQINRFLELVEDVVKDYPNKDMHIIDFGCGKSYLTFILYYYLVEIKKYQVHMTGLDLKEDVIRKCNETARKYHYENLHFELGDINGYHTDEPVDMVVTLHACDTATDYALYNAITWKAGIILSVPCCQHELNAQMDSDTFSILTRYGIVKERVSALVTDAIRGNVLTCCGYQTQLLEFVDFAASPKNILIRAVRGQVSEKKKEQAKEEIKHICEEFHLEQTLVKLTDIL